MSFFSHIGRWNRYNPYQGSGYYQQPPMQQFFTQPQYQNPSMGTGSISCPQCYESIVIGSKFCPFCGIKIKQNIATACSDCGNIIKGNDKFCSGCGKKVG